MTPESCPGSQYHGGDAQASRAGQHAHLTGSALAARSAKLCLTPNTDAAPGLTGGSLDHPAAGAGLATLQFPRRHHQVMVDRPEQAAVAPVVELTLHRRGWREIVRE